MALKHLIQLPSAVWFLLVLSEGQIQLALIQVLFLIRMFYLAMLSLEQIRVNYFLYELRWFWELQFDSLSITLD